MLVFRSIFRRVAAGGGCCLLLTGCSPDAQLFDERRARTPPPRESPRSADARAAAPPPASAPPTLDPGDSLAPGAPAQLGPVMVTLAVDCVRVQVEANRPVTAAIVLTLDGVDGPEWPLGAGATLFDAAFRVDGKAGAPGLVHVRALAAEGPPLQASPIEFSIPAPAGGLVITEVLANPAGAETRQEYVELTNLTAQTESTAGLRIEDAAGADNLPEALIAPGARVLVVGASFDEQNPLDVPPRPGTQLLRVPGRIGRDGLGQAGELVRLLGPGTLVRSSYAGWIDTRRPAWAGHSVHRRPDDGCDHPSVWSSSPMPATPGW